MFSQVATRPADNPVGLVARRLHLGGVAREAPKLSLPGKLVFPSMHQAGHFSMLGLGDVVMPGLLLCFVLRYDAYKKSQLVLGGCEAGVPPPRHLSRISYFHCSLIGYFLGLLTATVSSEVFKAAQPALLYLVPFTLLPLLTMAYLKVIVTSCLGYHCEYINKVFLANLLKVWSWRPSICSIFFILYLLKNTLNFLNIFLTTQMFLINYWNFAPM